MFLQVASTHWPPSWVYGGWQPQSGPLQVVHFTKGFPLKPGGHSQSKLPGRFLQKAFAPHAGSSLRVHSSTSRHTPLPSLWNPRWHTHLPWEQSSPLGHGLAAEHWVVSVFPSQATFGSPDDPEGHLHLKPPGVFSQKAPVPQGRPRHSLMSMQPVLPAPAG